MANQKLEDYYRTESVFQRLAQASHTIELLQSALNRINLGARDYMATGNVFIYKDIPYPQVSLGEVKPATLVEANLINGDNPLVYRLKLVGDELLVGKEALTVVERVIPFVSLKDKTTARDQVKKLVDETVRTMDDLMVKLIEANHSRIPVGGNIGDYLYNIGVRDLMTTRVALAGSPPDKFFEDIKNINDKYVDGLKREIRQYEREVDERFGAPQTVHLTLGPKIQDGIRK